MFLHKFKTLRRCSTNSAANSFYVTTPIFYVNAAPHIGHLYSAVIADAVCRYKRLRDPTAGVHLSTGTDEHGTKIQQAAAANNVLVAEYCDNISARYCDVFLAAHVAHTDFIRTTEERHKQAVAHFWRSLQSKGHIYSASYSGWYCVSDETFLTEAQLHLDEPSDVRYSLESGHPVEWTEEINYMFRLSKLQDDVVYWLKQGGRVRPAKFEKILLDMLTNERLPDVSVSRPLNRVHWAIPVPGDDTQTIYVWLDALVNYLTSCGYPHKKYLEHWPPTIQVLGKDILKFHGIYWPAFLIAAGLEPPKQLFVHSHWTVDGQKMSKSKHNVVDPQEAAKVYSMEGLRYFLLREGVAHSDGNYSSVKAQRILNSELADTLGNLLSRACAKSLNPRQVYPVIDEVLLNDMLRTPAAQRLKENIQQLDELCEFHYTENNFYLVVDTVMFALHAANNFFESSRPWELKRNIYITAEEDRANTKKLETIIGMAMDTLRLCAIVLQPIVPQLCSRLLDKLSVPEEERLWANLGDNFTAAAPRRQIGAEKPLGSADAILFRRIVLKDDIPAASHSQATKTAEVESKRQQKKAARKARKEAA